jgi:putative ABC transport system substrate-binding protein
MSRPRLPSDLRYHGERNHRLGRRCLLGIAAATIVPSIGNAQSSRIPTIGVLVVGAPGSEQFWKLFQKKMAELGYVEGRSIRYEFRTDRGQASRLPELAADLVRLKVDLIVTWYTPPAQAAKQATRDIPIVMALAGDPVGTGLVESLDRPGGNITGMAGAAAELSSKSVEIIREMLPGARRIVALANAPDPFSKPFLEYSRMGGAAIGITVDGKLIRGADSLDAAFREMESQRPDAVLIQPSLPRRRAAELAVQHRIPSVSLIRSFATEEGGLMSYSPSEPEVYGRAAAIVDKILRGARPADLPVEQPTKFDLVVNTKVAKALGLAITPTFLVRADEVIE